MAVFYRNEIPSLFSLIFACISISILHSSPPYPFTSFRLGEWRCFLCSSSCSTFELGGSKAYFRVSESINLSTRVVKRGLNFNLSVTFFRENAALLLYAIHALLVSALKFSIVVPLAYHARDENWRVYIYRISYEFTFYRNRI